MKVYLAVGHGTRPDGRFDPGAIGLEGEREHDFNHLIGRMVANYVKDAEGLELTLEENDGDHEDPNYAGSITAVNAGDYDFALSIHFDWNRAPRGGFGLFYSTSGEALAKVIAREYAAQDLPQRANSHRTDLSFIKRTRCPAVIWEVDRIGAMTSDELIRAATAIGDGIMRHAGATLEKEEVTPPPPERDPDTPTEALVKRLFQDIAGRTVDPAPRNWVGAIDGDPVRGTAKLIGALILEMRSNFEARLGELEQP